MRCLRSNLLLCWYQGRMTCVWVSSCSMKSLSLSKEGGLFETVPRLSSSHMVQGLNPVALTLWLKSGIMSPYRCLTKSCELSMTCCTAWPCAIRPGFRIYCSGCTINFGTIYFHFNTTVYNFQFIILFEKEFFYK